MIIRALVLLSLSGCSLSWTCTVPVVVRLEDTRTTVRCPTDGRQVVIVHPKAKP